MDALSPLLEDLRLQEGYYCWSEVRAPWGASFPASAWCSFEYVVEGGGWLMTDGETTALGKGDFFLLPTGRPYAVADRPGRSCVPFAELPFERLGERLMRLRLGGDGAASVSICGGARLCGAGAKALLQALPHLILIRAGAEAGHAWLPPLMESISLEAQGRRMGSPAVLTRLIEALILQTVRAWSESAADRDAGWLGALRDPRIGRALALMHGDPGAPWSLDGLARETGCSRTVFSERFARRVGCSPMRYLARWRMDLAGQWLEEGGMTMAEVAERLSYGSEAALSRAFKRHHGMPPGRCRSLSKTGP